MKRYARIQDGRVAELFETDRPIGTLFHSGIVWIELPAGSEVGPGWAFKDQAFGRPSPAPADTTMSYAETVAAIETLRKDVFDLKRIVHGSGTTA